MSNLQPLDLERGRSTWRGRIADALLVDAVDIQLLDRHIDHAIDQGLRLWAKYQPVRIWFPFVTMAAVTTIVDFSTQRDDGVLITGIKRVRFKSRRTLLGAQAAPLPVGDLYWDARGPRVYYELRYSEAVQEYFTGTEPDWFYDTAEGVLYIYSPRQPLEVMALATRPSLLTDIKSHDEFDFETYVVGNAETKLAKIQGQLGSVPHPSGEITPNYQELAQEGREKMTRVEDTLSRRMSSVPVPRWI